MYSVTVLNTYRFIRELQQARAVDAVFDTCELHAIDVTAFVEFLCAIGHYDASRVTHLA